MIEADISDIMNTMQFQVPQFLDVEDKIIGPFTMKQFLYIGGGAGMAYMAWRFVPYLGYLLAFGCVALGGALAFYKFNNKPFAYLIESAFNYIKSTRMYIWQKKGKGPIDTQLELDLSNFQTTKHVGVLPVANVTTSKLNDLTWSIDVQSSNIETQKVRSDSGVI